MEKFKAPSQSKRGPLRSDVTPSRLYYKCLAANCNKTVRGDTLPQHYLKNVDTKILEIAQNMTEDDGRTTIINLISDDCIQNHTLFFFKEGFSAKNLPSYRGHKREIETKVLSPFEQMAAAKKKKSSSSSDSDSIFDEQVPSTSNLATVQALSEDHEKVPDIPDASNVLEIPHEHLQEPEKNQDSITDQENVSVYDQVRAALKDHAMSLPKEDLDQLATMICAKTIQMQELQDKEKKILENCNELWLNTGNMIVCQPCLTYSESTDLPTQLQKNRKGTLGYIKKNQAQFHINSAKSAHLKNPIHVWCVLKDEKVKKSRAESDHVNAKAGEKVIRNALFCFKRGLGSEDFVALNEKDLGSDIKNTATKNDSRAEFFKLRNTVFELLSEKTRQFFKDKIKFITVTLDKVTVQRTSYTVILTFFFFEGKIHVILNKLVKLATGDYDAQGTAEMVINTLTDTLGITRSKLSTILVHFVYDGVYATKEERVYGGGSLELKHHVAESLGLDIGDITSD